MKQWQLLTVVGMATLVQGLVLSASFSYPPNLVLVLLLWLGLRFGFGKLLPAALLAGLLLDVVGITAFGARALLYPSILLLVAAAHRSGIDLNSRFAMMTALTLAVLLLNGGLLLLTWIELREIVWHSNIIVISVSRALLTGLFAWFLPRPVQ